MNEFVLELGLLFFVVLINLISMLINTREYYRHKAAIQKLNDEIEYLNTAPYSDILDDAIKQAGRKHLKLVPPPEPPKGA